MSGKEEWRSLIRKIKVTDLVRTKGQLFVLKASDSVRHALNVLSEANILSTPVINDLNQFIGFLDVLDIAGWVLGYWRSKSPDYEAHHFPTNEFFDISVMSVLNFSLCDTAVTINENNSVEDLIKLFCHPNTHHSTIHRVAVLSGDGGAVVGVVSQSDVIRFAAQHTSLLGAEGHKTVQELGLIKRPIVVRLDTPFVEALDLLYRNRISGLALVDQDFHLTGNLSASDLRGFQPNSFSFFEKSVLSFLARGSKRKIQHAGPPVSCGLEADLAELLQTASAEKVHRVYITDDNNHPRSVIALGDLISKLL